MTSNNAHLTYLKIHLTVPPLEWENSAVESPLSTCVQVWRKLGLLHIFLRPYHAGQNSRQICVPSLHMIIIIYIMVTADIFLCWQFSVKPIVNAAESRFHVLSDRMLTRRHSAQRANSFSVDYKTPLKKNWCVYMCALSHVSVHIHVQHAVIHFSF